MNELPSYNVSATDWRLQLRRNQHRTRWVIGIYLLTYTLLGVLIDVIIYQHFYPRAPLGVITHALLTFQLMPYATLSMAGVAILGLWITYLWYDKIMLMGTSYHEISPTTAQSLEEKQLYNVVEEMKVAAGLNFMPKVYIIDADYMNAFASGFSERSAMVAITRGLMQKLDRNEMQAVMAHELSHIRHQDIKLTLMASILSNIMLIVVDILFYNLVFDKRRKVDGRLVLLIIILRYVLPMVTVLLMLYLSRTREYMADAGCVELMRDNQPLARALIKIDEDYKNNLDHYRTEYDATSHEDVRRAAYLYDPVQVGAEAKHSFTSFFATHPTLDERLQALGIKR